MGSGPKIQPEGAAVPARPTGQTALSAAPNRRKSETPILQVQAQEAPRFAQHLLRLDLPMGVSDLRRFGAAERAVWPVGRAGTAAPSGWILGPELTLTSH